MHAAKREAPATDDTPWRDITGRVLRAFFEVNRELGHGFLEAEYVRALRNAMVDLGLFVEPEVRIPVRFRGAVIGCFRADLLVERAVIVEVKARPQLEPAHTAQLLNYLRASEIEVGLLLNCSTRPTFKRLVFGNARQHGLRPSAAVCGSSHGCAPGSAAPLDASRPRAPR